MEAAALRSINKHVRSTMLSKVFIGQGVIAEENQVVGR